METNPVPKFLSISFLDCNSNGFTAHNFFRVSSFYAHITEYNYDIICRSETFLNSSIGNDEDRLKIDGFILLRSDHSNGLKKESSIVFKNMLFSLERMIYVLSVNAW